MRHGPRWKEDIDMLEAVPGREWSGAKREEITETKSQEQTKRAPAY